MTVLLGVWLVGWSLAMLLCRVGSPPTTRPTPFTRLKHRLARGALPRGLEDDPTRWPPRPTPRDWTELDERQLIRLLTDAASTTPPAGDSP